MRPDYVLPQQAYGHRLGTHSHTYFGGGGGGDVEGLHEVGGEGSPALVGVLLFETACLIIALGELGHSSMQRLCVVFGEGKSRRVRGGGGW